MEEVIKQAFEDIESFLLGTYDPMDFSFDFPAKMVYNKKVWLANETLLDALNEVPSVCADYDDDYPLEKFKERVRVEYEKAKAIYEQEKH